VLGFLGGEGISLEEYSKRIWLGFLPLLKRVSQDTSSVLVHGASSYDLGCCNINGYEMLKWNELHA
jgi:hypothetical protein